MKIVLMVWLAALLACSSVHAGSFIIGANLGVATGGEDAGSLNKQLEENGIIANATTNGDIRAAWQTYITYQFLTRWGVELAYVDLGKATISIDGVDQDIGDVLDKIGDNHPRSAQGAKLSATHRFELNKSLQLQSKLGVFYWETSYAFEGKDDNDEPLIREFFLSGTDISAGLGLVHKLTNNVSAHLDWNFYSIDAAAVNLFTFGVSYQFH